MSVIGFPTAQERTSLADEAREKLLAEAERVRELVVYLDQLIQAAQTAAIRAGRSRAPFDAAENHIASAMRCIRWATQAITE